MSLIRSESSSLEPYQPGVYMITGINGIGKSTIVDAIALRRPETTPLHASLELRGLFGNISREELEHLTPEEKLCRMVMHFTTIFERNLNDQKAVIMDTHLLVPIRNDETVTYEDIWSREYTPYVASMTMLSARPSAVRRWRLEDERVTGRRRNTGIAEITRDQELNINRFNELYANAELPSGSSIIENQSGFIEDTTAAVDQVFRAA